MRRLSGLLVGLVGAVLVFNLAEAILAISLFHHWLPAGLAVIKYTPYVLLLAGLAGAMWWRLRTSGSDWFRHLPREIWIAIALLAWCLVNLSFSSASLWQSMRGFNTDFAGLLLFMTIWLLGPGRTASRRLLWVIIGVLGTYAAVSLPEVFANTAFRQFTNHNLFNHYVVGTIPQLRSLLSGPNPFGTVLALLAVLVAITVRPIRWKLPIIAVIGLLLGLTFARSAWIGIGVAGGGYFFWQLKQTGWRAMRTVWPLVLGASILAGAAFGAVRYNESVFNVLTHGSSTEEHAQTAKESLDATYQQTPAQTLFGHGLGTAGPVIFDTAEASKRDTIKIVESWYLQLIQEIGLVGFALYLWLYGMVAGLLWRRDQRAGWLAIGLAVNAITLHIWSADANLNLMFWAFAGLMLYGQLGAQPDPATRPRTSAKPANPGRG